jgi:hypothetical protein
MKTRSKIMMTAFFIAAFGGTIYAQNNATTKETKAPSSTNSSNRGQFVDNNKNGVCDNFDARGNGRGQGYQHRHGQGKGQGNCNGRGRGFGRGNPSGCLNANKVQK